MQLLRPEQFQPVLTTVPYRAKLLERYGVDHVLILPTTLALLQLSPREFFEQVARERLAAKAIVEGFNFAFGHDREGTVDTLKALCAEASLGLILVPAEELDGRPISSSRVRNALVQGQVRAAIELLGRPYQLSGVVGQGQRRGQTLGFPTANLEDIPTLIPGNGVYAVRVWHENQPWPGAANIGPNPTFGEQAPKIEVHLIDFRGDLYGQTLRVDFLERLRDTKPFAGPAELMRQLQADVEQARRILSSAPSAERGTIPIGSSPAPGAQEPGGNP